MTPAAAQRSRLLSTLPIELQAALEIQGDQAMARLARELGCSVSAIKNADAWRATLAIDLWANACSWQLPSECLGCQLKVEVAIVPVGELRPAPEDARWTHVAARIVAAQPPIAMEQSVAVEHLPGPAVVWARVTRLSDGWSADLPAATTEGKEIHVRVPPRRSGGEE